MYLKPGTKGVDQFTPRWEPGTWLGIRDESGEIIVGIAEDVVKARDFKRMGSQSDRSNVESILESVGTPWEPIP